MLKTHPIKRSIGSDKKNEAIQLQTTQFYQSVWHQSGALDTAKAFFVYIYIYIQCKKCYSGFIMLAGEL